MSHIIITVIWMGVAGLLHWLTGEFIVSWVMAGLITGMWYGREEMQAEYRQNYVGRARYSTIVPWAWKSGAILLSITTVISVVIALVLTLVFR